ncbi:hypothetical protein ACHAQJ_000315 [Trichoderma viride]
MAAMGSGTESGAKDNDSDNAKDTAPLRSALQDLRHLSESLQVQNEDNWERVNASQMVSQETEQASKHKSARLGSEMEEKEVGKHLR